MSPGPLGLDSRPTKAAGLAEEDLDGEKAVLSVERGAYFAMNEVAGRIFALVDGQRSVADICGVLTEEYDVEEGRCREEVLRHLETLRSMGLVSP